MTDLVSLLFVAMIPIDCKITNFSLHLLFFNGLNAQATQISQARPQAFVSAHILAIIFLYKSSNRCLNVAIVGAETRWSGREFHRITITPLGLTSSLDCSLNNSNEVKDELFNLKAKRWLTTQSLLMYVDILWEEFRSLGTYPLCLQNQLVLLENSYELDSYLIRRNAST